MREKTLSVVDVSRIYKCMYEPIILLVVLPMLGTVFLHDLASF